MASLSASGSASVNLLAGQSLVISQGGYSTISPSSSDQPFDVGIQGGVVGPYAFDVTIYITVQSGSISYYSVSPAPKNAVTLYVATDSNGNTTGIVNTKDGKTIPFLLSKIRASIASAQNNNPQVKAPYAPAPLWAVNTVYYGGMVVRGIAVGSTDKLYYMCGSDVSANASGTSNIAGTGPSGEGTSIITDATCRWIYFGKISATTATPLMSTAVLASPTDNMNGYLQLITNANFLTIGLTSYQPSASSGTFLTEAFFTGGIFGYKSTETLSQPNTGSVGSPSYNAPPKNTIAFSTNARKWVGIKGSAAAVLGSYYTVEVNGVILGESSVYPTSTTTSCLLINLSLFKEGNKDIRIHWNNNTFQRLAYEVLVSAGEIIWPTENGNRWRLACEGDSITNGSYISGAGANNLLFERLLADRLGCDHYYNNAVGGTGMINNNAGATTTYLERLPDVIAFNPDVLFIGGMHNDVGNAGAYTSATRRTAILSYLTAVRAGLPNCFIFIIGTQLLQNDQMTTGGAVSLYDVEVDVREAVITFNDSKTSFIPLLTDVRNRLVNTNGSFYLVGTSPYNDAHPIPMYYPFITGYIAEKIKKFFGSLTY